MKHGPPLRIVTQPKAQPGPATSWWTAPVDRATWYRRAQEEVDRLRLSKETNKGGSVDRVQREYW